MPKPGSLLRSIPQHILQELRAPSQLKQTTASNNELDLTKFQFEDESQVPENLKKYYAQRYRYFSRYDEGCLLDDQGWYSVTPELLADQIAERCRCDTILDAFCGVGGNAIAFAKTCERVIAIDNSPTRLALAKHNAKIYGVDHRIEFILGDYLAFAASYTQLPPKERRIDVVFLSPPWGGPSYLSHPIQDKHHSDEGAEPEQPPSYPLDSIEPINGRALFQLTKAITPNIAYFLPRNTDLVEVSKLVSPVENIEVEEEWMGNKLKALTCYFGGLVVGHEHLF